ncbi:site-2 protease family protein [Wenzhouxiangella sp. AB-CW3]|uniref:site-2 protease family protein n=1 Tax=Wenzhouxiangella sp. AB-CW3 TaxID=2771012 RepID=UPI00168C000E|nr:site-2 protease family protein [Wenzhouxiangella sp. AB-CW3]QOC23564.1 site-2 protease family protein [Wenzhouxiangella sp. AB-CW3]
MFRSVLVLGYIRGIRIEIHVSWLIIFVLLLASLGTGLSQAYPDWSITAVVITTVLTVLLFFASILAHELGHSVVAIRRGIPVRAITLFIFGGMAQISRDSESADDEFWIAIAGPAVSFALAAGFLMLSLPAAQISEPLSVAMSWLGLINLIVAIFNLIPGFPLDGGRVFRALVWKFTGDAARGMRAAVMGGRLVAYALFAVGLWIMLAMNNLLGGLWIMIIAWFLLNMAEASGRDYGMRERLRGLCARDLADRNLPLVSPSTPVDEWVHDHMLAGGLRAHFIGDRNKVVGLATLSDARKLPREQWPQTTVADIMTPVGKLVRVSPDSSAEDILRLINEHSLNQVPVMDDDRVIGWIDRRRLLGTIELHLELKA